MVVGRATRGSAEAVLSRRRRSLVKRWKVGWCRLIGGCRGRLVDGGVRRAAGIGECHFTLPSDMVTVVGLLVVVRRSRE